MNDLSSLVARYKDTLTAYCNNKFIPIATDKFGRIIFSHIDSSVSGTGLYSSVRIGDGVDELSILNIGDSLVGETGVMVFGQGVSGEAAPIPIVNDNNNNPAVNVTIAQPVGVSGSIDIDPTPGTDGDQASDEGGINTEPGVVGGIGTSTWVDIVSRPVTSGQYVITGVHMSVDLTCQWRLVIDDNGTITTWLGNWMVFQGNPTINMPIWRGREVNGIANRSIKLQAIRKALCTDDANVSGRINGFTR